MRYELKRGARVFAGSTLRALMMPISYAYAYVSMAYGEQNVEVCPGEEQAGDEAGTRDQRRECAHEGDAAAGGGTH